MSKDVRRIVTVPLLGPPLMAPLMVLGSPGLDWWRYLVFSVGCGYLLPVLGGLAGRLLADRAARRSTLASHAVRGLVKMGLIVALVVLLFLVREPSLSEALDRISRMVRWEVAAGLVIIGLLCAVPQLDAWGRDRHCG